VRYPNSSLPDAEAAGNIPPLTYAMPTKTKVSVDKNVEESDILVATFIGAKKCNDEWFIAFVKLPTSEMMQKAWSRYDPFTLYSRGEECHVEKFNDSLTLI
jgi:hypothetical protein